MSGLETIAICSRVEDAYALAGWDYENNRSYQVVAKMFDTV
jgi:hypothetical protein